MNDLQKAKRLLHNISSSEYYNRRIGNDKAFYAAEKKRVAKYQKERYKNDKEYREKIKAYNRKKNQEYYWKNKKNENFLKKDISRN